MRLHAGAAGRRGGVRRAGDRVGAQDARLLGLVRIGSKDPTIEIVKNREEVVQHRGHCRFAHEITISFNAQYVLDFLNVVESEVVALELKDEVSQAVMKPVGADGYDYTYVIMPMRV